MSFYNKIPIHGGGCKVFTVLCSLGKLADSTLSVYMYQGYDEEGCGFQLRSPGKFSYNQSKRYGLVCWNSILPGKTWNFTSTLLHG